MLILVREFFSLNKLHFPSPFVVEIKSLVDKGIHITHSLYHSCQWPGMICLFGENVYHCLLLLYWGFHETHVLSWLILRQSECDKKTPSAHTGRIIIFTRYHCTRQAATLMNALWPCDRRHMATHNLINISSGNGLLSDDTKQLPG